jgi:serine/threonine-protein kinase RsbW
LLDSESRVLVELEIAVPAIPQHLEDLHQALTQLWHEIDRVWSRPPDTTWKSQFATGVAEIGANIIQYAYPSDEPGVLAFRLRVFDQGIEAYFSDTGRSYEGDLGAAQPEPTDPMMLAESGRGIALAQAAVDHLTYEREPGGTNHWCLSKCSASND